MPRNTTIKFEVAKRTKEYFRKLRDLLGKVELYRRVIEFFDVQAQVVAGQIVRDELSGQVLARRTGSLARSIIGRGELVDGVPGFRVGVLRGPALKYAAAQELGTVGKGGELPTIVPTRAKALAIPLAPALTAAGVPRWLGPRQSPVVLKFIPFRRGIAVGALYAASDLAKMKKEHLTLRDIQAYYLLVTSVDLKPRLFLRKGVQRSLPHMAAELDRFLKELITNPGQAAPAR